MRSELGFEVMLVAIRREASAGNDAEHGAMLKSSVRRRGRRLMAVRRYCPFREGAVTAGPVGGDAAMLAGLRAGKTVRAIAVEVHGADRVAAEWGNGGWMRAKVRRLARRARAASDKGPDNAGPGTR